MAAAGIWDGKGRGHLLRALGWGGAAALLALPAAAMRFAPGAGVDWTGGDFAVMGAMLGTVGLGIEIAVRTSGDRGYRAGAAVVLGTGFLLLWANLAVGLVGNEDNPANLLFVGVLAVAAAGAAVARLRPAGTSRALGATAAAQLLAAAVAFTATPTVPRSGIAVEIVSLVGAFPGLWLLSAWLFAQAERRQAAHAVA